MVSVLSKGLSFQGTKISVYVFADSSVEKNLRKTFLQGFFKLVFIYCFFNKTCTFVFIYHYFLLNKKQEYALKNMFWTWIFLYLISDLR